MNIQPRFSSSALIRFNVSRPQLEKALAEDAVRRLQSEDVDAGVAEHNQRDGSAGYYVLTGSNWRDYSSHKANLKYSAVLQDIVGAPDDSKAMTEAVGENFSYSDTTLPKRAIFRPNGRSDDQTQLTDAEYAQLKTALLNA